MNPRILALALLLLPAAEDELRYAPGGAARKTFREETSFELTSLTHLPSEELPADQVDFTGRTWRELELVDRPGPIEDGRPQRLERAFESAAKGAEIDFNLQGLEELYELELDSLLAGESVRFVWNAEEQTFEARSETGFDSSHLERLREDCDLRALLPPAGEEHGVGDSWTVDAAELAELLCPAGRVVFTADAPPDGPYVAMTPVDVAALTFLTVADASRELEGEARLTWKESTGERDERTALLTIELEAQLSGDMNEDLARLVSDLGAGGRHEVELTFEWALEGQGELSWSVARGQFESLALELEGELELEMTWSEANGTGEAARAGARVGFTTHSALSASAEAE
jgi:hypothetical protein